MVIAVSEVLEFDNVKETMCLHQFCRGNVFEYDSVWGAPINASLSVSSFIFLMFLSFTDFVVGFLSVYVTISITMRVRKWQLIFNIQNPYHQLIVNTCNNKHLFCQQKDLIVLRLLPFSILEVMPSFSKNCS